jgi:glycosyltransferase involved in cell wall biosynthesis
MRIAMFSWESLHSIAVGGVAAHVTELSAALERKGHDVHVFTRLAKGQRSHELIHGVHYHRCPMHLQNDFVDEVNGMCGSFAHHFACVEDAIGPFDVVHAHDWLAANAMIWVKQQRRKPGVLTMHSTDYGRSGNVFHGGQSERVRHQERAGTYWADKVIAVSHATKAELTWMYEVPEEKVAVVYNGVSNHRFEGEIDQGSVKQRYGIAPLDPTVLFCGRLVQQKGPDLFVGAIPSVLKYHPSAKFVFAGDGHLRAGLERQAERIGISHATRFLGHRDGQELVDLFKMADALCVPSRNEPFGIVVLEAWSAGKPVVATMNGGPNEYVRHEIDGLKIYANSDSVAWGLGTLFSDWDKARSMGQAGKAAVAKSFTWEVIAGQTLDVYADLLAQSRPRPEPQVLAVESGDLAPAPSTSKGPERPVTWSPSKPEKAAVGRSRGRRRRSRSGSALAGA